MSMRRTRVSTETSNTVFSKTLRWGTLLALIGGLLSLVLFPEIAAAQNQLNEQTPLPTFDLQRFRPAPNPSDFFTLYGASVAEHLTMTGGFYLHAGSSPLTLFVGATDAHERSIVDYQFGGDAFFSLPLYDRFELAISIPFLMAQESSTSGAPFSESPTASGFGDARFVAKGEFLDIKEYPVGFSGLLVLSVPTSGQGSLYGDESVGVEARLLLDYKPYKNIRTAFNLGYRYRSNAARFGPYNLGDAIIIGGAGSIPFFSKKVDFVSEINAEITVAANNSDLVSEERPVELINGIRYRIVRKPGFFKDLQLTAALGLGSKAVGSPSARFIFGLGFFNIGGGVLERDYDFGGYIADIKDCPDPKITPPEKIPPICREEQLPDSDNDGIPDRDDQCPFRGTPETINNVGCPKGDRDGDGIPDKMDRCPDSAEDKDGIADEDGCPENDFDGDTIIDSEDECPLIQEVFNGIDDEDGCPDDDPNARVSLHDGQVHIKEQVFFKTGKAKIKGESFPLLNEVAELLISNPQTGSVEVEGYTDDRGDADDNQELSQERAEAVVKYLVDAGVEAKRLNAIGFGEASPIADNETEEGRALNRRVEFKIKGIDSDEPPP